MLLIPHLLLQPRRLQEATKIEPIVQKQNQADPLSWGISPSASSAGASGRVGIIASEYYNAFVMRTTIELKEEHRALLHAIAARRGWRGYSKVIEEAIEFYL